MIIQDLQNDVIIEGGAFADSGAPGARDEPERRRERQGPRRGRAQGGRAGDPRLVHRRAGRAGPEAERAALPGRQGRERARARLVGRGARGRPRAAGRRPRRREDADERLLRDAARHPAARPRRRDARSSPAPGRTCRSSTPPATPPTPATELVVASDGTSTVDEEWQNAALSYAMTNVALGRHLRRDRRRVRRLRQLQALEWPRWPPPSASRCSSSTRTPARRSRSSTPRPARRSPTVPRMGRPRRAGRSRRAEAALPAWRALLAKDRARILRRWADLMLDHEEELAAPAHDRAGQAARRVARRDRSTPRRSSSGSARRRKRVYGDTIPTYALDRRIVVTKEPDRRHRRHHAVELPGRDADPQVGAGARGRLHDGAEAGRADAALGAGDRAARRGGGRAARASSSSSPATPRTRRRSARELTAQPDRPQARLHRLDRGRQAPDGAVRRSR